MRLIATIILLTIQCTILNASSSTQRANQSKCDTNRISTLLNLSKEYDAINLYKAERFANSALKLAYSANDKKQLMKVYVALGNLNNLREDETETLDNFFKGLDLALELNDRVTECKIYNCVGASYGLYNDTSNAFLYLNKAMLLAKELNDPNLLASQYNNLGLVYKDAQLYDTSLHYFYKSLLINQSRNNTDDLILNYVNIGNIYLLQNSMDSAFKYFNKELILSRNVEGNLSLANAYTSIASFYFHNKKFNKAILYADSALFLAQKSGYSSFLINLYNVKAESYYQTKNFDDSYKYYAKLTKLLDSTRSNNIYELTSNFNAKQLYETHKKRDEMTKNKLLIEKQDAEIKLYLVSGSLIIALLIFVIVYILLIQRSRKGTVQHNELKKQKLIVDNKLELKNKELTTNVMELINRNELLNKVIYQLEEIRDTLNQKNKSTINNVLKSLRSGLKENVWEEFKMRFQNVHSGFRKNLVSEHRDLTPNEKNCARF